MKRLLITMAAFSLVLGPAASAWAQSGPMSPGYCNRSTGDIADCLNRGIADRNDAATTTSYGSSGAARGDMIPTVPTTTTTQTTTTYSRTIYAPSHPGAAR